MFRPIAKFLRSSGWREWQVSQQRTATKMLWQIFDSQSEYPAIIAKLYPPSSAEEGQNTARTLQYFAPLSLSLGIPQLLHASMLPDQSFLLIESGLPGHSFADELSIDDPEIGRQFRVVQPWVARFQASVHDCGSLAKAVASSIQACKNNIPEMNREEADVLLAAERASAQLGAIPAFPVHGDFWGRNVLQHGTGISVIDWDTFHYGVPLEDEYQFLIGAVLNGKTPSEELIWQAFFGESPLVQLLKSATLSTFKRLELSPQLIVPFFVIFLTNRMRFTAFHAHASWRSVAARYASAGFPVPFQTLP